MASQNDRGFVDCFSSVRITRGGIEVVGDVDVVMCGNCLEQAAQLVGSATRQQTEEITREAIELREENEKLKDEIGALNQRHYSLIDKLSETTKREVENV